MDATRYWIGTIFIAFGLGALLYWLSVHPFVAFWRRVGSTRTLIIHYTAMIVLASLVIWQRDHVMIGDYGTNYPFVAIAVVLVVVSGIMRYFQTQNFDTKTLTGLAELDPERFDSHLVTEGLYARMRHPRYVQLFVALIGYALFVNYLAGYLLLLVSLIVTLLIVRLEERELVDRFGDAYRDYIARVPRFFPARHQEPRSISSKFRDSKQTED